MHEQLNEGSSTNDNSTDNDNNSCHMKWTIIHDIKIFKITYKLKLIKIKQNDIEILYQIISDMGNEINQLKKENEQLKKTINDSKSMIIIASWSTNCTLQNNYVYVLTLKLCFFYLKKQLKHSTNNTMIST